VDARKAFDRKAIVSASERNLYHRSTARSAGRFRGLVGAKIREACIMEYPGSPRTEWAIAFLPSAAIWLTFIAGLSLL
jgi:hypothetical protein